MPLFVVATPIGNLEDLSLRAIRVLREADIVVAEDTRHSRALLASHGISRPMQSLHEHSDDARLGEIEEAVRAGKSVALISDAGTPLVSDPGFELVRRLRSAGEPVFCVPGASAVTAFLSVAGLPVDRFLFVGFLPRAEAERRELLRAMGSADVTLVAYESPNRLVSSLGSIAVCFPGAAVAVGRELTKRFEEVRLEPAESAVAYWGGLDEVRGECVLGFRPKRQETGPSDATLEAWIDALTAEGLRTKSVARILSRQLGVASDVAYARALARTQR